SQGASWRVEREHRECCSEVQHLHTQLEKAHSSLLSQELELERLRPFEALLGRHQMDLQVRRDAVRGTGGSLHHTGLPGYIHEEYCSLEDCLAAQGCAGVDILRKDLERTAAKLQGAQVCEAHLEAELREELERARQTHSGEVEGMKREVSKLTSELHQRDLSIATLSSSSSSIKQQLRSELQRAEQKAAELKVSLLQAQKTVTSYEGEMQRLFKSLHILPKSSNEEHGTQSKDNRPHSFSSSSSSSSSSARLTRRHSVTALTPPKSGAEGQSSSSEDSLTSGSREKVIPSPSLGVSFPKKHIYDSAPLHLLMAIVDICFLPHQEALSVSPAHSAVTRFLEEETLWSNELQQKLESHIQGMKENNLRTVTRFLADSSGQG
ncbi:hypothetical protein XENOCAPTIV_024322, partial [Xenoophorus captivus]